MNEIRLGTIGSGTIVQGILRNVQRTEGISLEAVYSRKEETGGALARKFGAEKVYTDLAEFFADKAVNVVYIASPNSLHYEYAKKALEAGKHVLCEKPFCTRIEQARELNALAQEKGLMLAEMIPTAFLPNLQVIWESLPKLGRIRLVMANYSQYSSRYDHLLAGNITNVFSPEFAGGCLMDINYYNLYLTVALFGVPESAVYTPNLHANGIDTSGIVHLRYPDFQATLCGAKDTRGINFYQIEGEKGYLYVTDGSNGLKEVRIGTADEDGEESINLQPDPDRLYYEVQEVTELLRQEDAEAFRARLQTTMETIRATQELRKKAGLVFPGD